MSRYMLRTLRAGASGRIWPSTILTLMTKMRQVRIELTTLGLWDLRAANCAIAA